MLEIFPPPRWFTLLERSNKALFMHVYDFFDMSNAEGQIRRGLCVCVGVDIPPPLCTLMNLVQYC